MRFYWTEYKAILENIFLSHLNLGNTVHLLGMKKKQLVMKTTTQSDEALKNMRCKTKRVARQEEWRNQQDDNDTNLLTVVLRELAEEPASLLGLEISQHGGDDGADVFWERVKWEEKSSSTTQNISQISQARHRFTEDLTGVYSKLKTQQVHDLSPQLQLKQTVSNS